MASSNTPSSGSPSEDTPSDAQSDSASASGSQPTSRSSGPGAGSGSGSARTSSPNSPSSKGSSPTSASSKTPSSTSAGGNRTAGTKGATGNGARSRKGVVIGAVVAVAALLAGWLSQYAVNGGSDSGGSEGGQGSGNATVEGGQNDTAGNPELMKLARRDADDPFARGARDAPVVMIEYADFGCSFCGKFARDTEPKLEKKYIDKGLLRVEWRNFPVFGKGSERAALAGVAAGKQDRFWQFYRTVYADEKNEKNAFSDSHLHDLAQQAGVKDLDRFDRDRKSQDAKKTVARDQNEAYSLGASATPAFLVNGEPIAGAQPDQTFTGAIDRAAAAARKQDGKGADGKQGGDS